ncbi:hypothetical protein MMC28_008818 [Mycoblastus sanguinarius]|nr:hypothetical protein [Mycoblastus sanguinarius]
MNSNASPKLEQVNEDEEGRAWGVVECRDGEEILDDANAVEPPESSEDCSVESPRESGAQAKMGTEITGREGEGSKEEQLSDYLSAEGAKECSEHSSLDGTQEVSGTSQEDELPEETLAKEQEDTMHIGVISDEPFLKPHHQRNHEYSPEEWTSEEIGRSTLPTPADTLGTWPPRHCREPNNRKQYKDLPFDERVFAFESYEGPEPLRYSNERLRINESHERVPHFGFRGEADDLSSFSYTTRDRARYSERAARFYHSRSLGTDWAREQENPLEEEVLEKFLENAIATTESLIAQGRNALLSRVSVQAKIEEIEDLVANVLTHDDSPIGQQDQGFEDWDALIPESVEVDDIEDVVAQIGDEYLRGNGSLGKSPEAREGQSPSTPDFLACAEMGALQ